MIFDGKAFAKEIEERVKAQVSLLNVKPKIVSVIVGDDPASVLYTKLKKAASERVGIEFEVLRLSDEISERELADKIGEVGERADVTGVMVQLPLPEPLRGSSFQDVLSTIPVEKDVDGLRWEESGTMPATVRAIISILEQIAESSIEYQVSGIWDKHFVVMGARGAVGRPLVHFLRERNVDVIEVEWDTPEPTRRVLEGDVIISCVGKAGIVTVNMIKDGAIVIDVGMSKKDGKIVGDMTMEVYQKASVAVPVPAGVGPVTVASLMQNGVDLCK